MLSIKSSNESSSFQHQPRLTNHQKCFRHRSGMLILSLLFYSLTALQVLNAQYSQYSNLRYPPIPLLSPGSAVQSGASYGNGRYTCSNSSSSFNRAFYAFDSMNSTSWNSSFSYRIDTGYQGPATTTLVNSTVIRGDWIQFTVPTPIILQSIYLTPRQGYRLSVKSFRVLGSNSSDSNSNWTVLHSINDESRWSTMATIRYLIPIFNYTYFDAFRLVVTEISGSTLINVTSYAVSISDFFITGSNGRASFVLVIDLISRYVYESNRESESVH